MLIESSETAAIARGEGVVLTFSEHARAALNNGRGHYKAALDPAESASAQDELMLSVWSLPELVEAATRSGRNELAAAALERLSERTRAAGTEWALGIEARSRALLSEGRLAEDLYREGIDRLGRCRVALGTRPCSPRLWRMAAAQEPPDRCPRPAAHSTRDVRLHGSRSVCRARRPRAIGDRREDAQAHRRDAKPAHRAGGADCRTRG
jgi:hypothetical protein